MPPRRKVPSNLAAARAKRHPAALPGPAEPTEIIELPMQPVEQPVEPFEQPVAPVEQPVELVELVEPVKPVEQMEAPTAAAEQIEEPCGSQLPFLEEEGEEEAAGMADAGAAAELAGPRARLEPVRKKLRVSAKWLASNASNISEIEAQTPQQTPSGVHAERRIIARFDGPVDEEQVAYEDRVCYTLPVRWRGLKSGGCCRCCCCLPLLKPLLLMPRRSILAGAAGGRRERRRGQEARRSAPRSRADGARATQCSTKEGGRGRGGGD